MKDIPYDSYEKILRALINDGYTEEEAEILICDVIEDQRYFDDVAKRVHKILTEDIKDKFKPS